MFRLGLQSLFADWNLNLQLSLHTDSSSSKAVGQVHWSYTDEDAMTAGTAAKHMRVVKVATC